MMLAGGIRIHLGQVNFTLNNHLETLMWLWVKKPVPKWLALASGNMDQNLRSPVGLILTHTHVEEPLEKLVVFRCIL